MKHVYLQHIPKTGGTSIRHFIWKKCDKALVRFIWSAEWKTAHETFKTKDQIRGLVKGKIKPQELFMYVFLRDPIEHSRSLYSWIKKYKPHPYHDYANKVNFTTWLNDYEHIDNYFCKLLAPRNKTAVVALENLKHFNHVGRLETIDTDMNIILKQMGLNLKYDGTHYDGTRTNKFEVSQDQIKIIKKRRIEDFKLMESL